ACAPWRSTRLDGELAERDAEVPALAGAGNRQRHFALGHGLRAARFSCAGVRLRIGIAAEHVLDGVHAGEFALAILERRLAEGEAATLGADVHRHRLAIAAVDGAVAGSG